MSRSSREDTERHREAIQQIAARLFRERGVADVSIVDIMSEVGLTHGGFYKHFSSKDELAADACEYAYQQTSKVRSSWIDPSQRRVLSVFIERYLTKRHRDNSGLGCPLPALAIDVGRDSKESPLRSVYANGLNEVIEEIANLPGCSENKRREYAIGVLAAMVGALMLARATKGNQLSDDILEATKSFLLEIME